MAVVTAGAVVTLMIAGRAAHRHPAVRSVLLATGSGIAFGMSSVFTKTVAVDWTDGVSAADLPSLAVIGVFATAGMLLSQASYRGAGLAAPLATLTVVNPVVAAAVGITMFGETFRYGATGTALALSCGVVAAGGLILLTTERMARAAVQAAAPEEPAEPATGPTAVGGLRGPTPAGELAGPAPVEELLAMIPEQPAPAALRDGGPGPRAGGPHDPGGGLRPLRPGRRGAHRPGQLPLLRPLLRRLVRPDAGSRPAPGARQILTPPALR